MNVLFSKFFFFKTIFDKVSCLYGYSEFLCCIADVEGTVKGILCFTKTDISVSDLIDKTIFMGHVYDNEPVKLL